VTPVQYAARDGLGLAGLIRTGAVSAGEVMAAAIARAEAVNPALNAIVHAAYDEALAATPGDGPFAGVPFVVKDLGCAQAGRPMTLGSRYLADFRAAEDSELWRRLAAAGVVAIGRTNAPEWGLSVTTEPALYGPTRNPWAAERSPGGSSGGTAAAVAAGIVPWGHANDGGGSIRIPASACGLFGLKPTRARTPAGPARSEGWCGMAIDHAITVSVRDSAALLDAVAGPEPGAPYAAPASARPFRDEVGAPPGRLRIALTAEPFDAVAVDPECVAAVEDAARLCAELGHEVVEARPDFDLAPYNTAKFVVVAANLAADLAEMALIRGRAPGPGELEPATRAIAGMSRMIDGAGLLAAIRRLQGVARSVGRFFTDFDVLLTPTLARPPAPLGTIRSDVEDLETLGRMHGPFIAFTALFNVTGQPAMSVPLHVSAEGLPIGVQFAGRFGDEATLFRLAAQLEEARPWAQHLPRG